TGGRAGRRLQAGGHADAKNIGQNGSVEGYQQGGDRQFPAPEKNEQQDGQGQGIGQGGGPGRAQHPQRRQAQPAEDQDGVQNDVEQIGGHHHQHGRAGVPDTLQCSADRNGPESKDQAQNSYMEVVHRQGQNRHVIGKQCQKGLGKSIGQAANGSGHGQAQPKAVGNDAGHELALPRPFKTGNH